MHIRNFDFFIFNIFLIFHFQSKINLTEQNRVFPQFFVCFTFIISYKSPAWSFVRTTNTQEISSSGQFLSCLGFEFCCPSFSHFLQVLCKWRDGTTPMLIGFHFWEFCSNHYCCSSAIKICKSNFNKVIVLWKVSCIAFNLDMISMFDCWVIMLASCFPHGGSETQNNK